MMKDILWTSQEVETVTGGKSSECWSASGISLSLQDLQPGDLYIATREDDLSEVFEKGAAAALISGRNEFSASGPILRVANVFEALQDLALAARYKTHAHVVAVQGRANRDLVHSVLSTLGRIHEGGRHLSLGMASIPEQADYALFGFSPIVRPDIAVVTEGGAASCDMIFETMPRNSVVLVNADDPYSVPTIARAKAAGIENVFTYGSGPDCDAQLWESITARNGRLVHARILGREYQHIFEPGEAFGGLYAAALLILKITGKSVVHALKSLSMISRLGQAKTIAQTNVSLLGDSLQAVFRITNMIDFGFGRQMAMLDNIVSASTKGLSFAKKDLIIPRRVDRLELMYAGHMVGTVRNAQDAIMHNHKKMNVEQIAPQALVPGDFVVFKNINENSKIMFSEALRLIPSFQYKKIKAHYAV